MVKFEKDSSFGGDLKLNSNETKVNNIIMTYKHKDLVRKPFIPSQHIFSSLEAIKESKLFEFIKKMPKGGITHIHETAMCSADFVVTLTNWDHLWQRVSKGTNKIITFKFSKIKPELEPDHKDICEWQQVAEVRTNMTRMGLSYDKHVRTFFTLYDENVNPRIQFVDPDVLWTKFHKVFDTIGSILKYAPARKAYFEQTLKEIHDDGVQYLEFRGGLAKVIDIL